MKKKSLASGRVNHGIQESHAIVGKISSKKIQNP